MKKAFITYLCNDLFIPGAVALINSLKFNKTKFPVCCMVTAEVTPDGRETLEKAGYSLIDIEKIYASRVEGIKDRYKENSWMMFTKLNLVKLIQFEKLIFLDADCLALENIDEMFDFPAISAVRDLSYGGLSAGVLVIEPNQALFDDMIKNLNNENYDNTYSDQSFLNWYTTEKRIWNEIPLEYNALQKRVPIQDKIKIYHYNGQKPWITDEEDTCRWRMGDNKIYEIWNYYYNWQQPEFKKEIK
jgi:glycogenin glucosyltransferase